MMSVDEEEEQKHILLPDTKSGGIGCDHGQSVHTTPDVLAMDMVLEEVAMTVLLLMDEGMVAMDIVTDWTPPPTTLHTEIHDNVLLNVGARDDRCVGDGDGDADDDGGDEGNGDGDGDRLAMFNPLRDVMVEVILFTAALECNCIQQLWDVSCERRECCSNRWYTTANLVQLSAVCLRHVRRLVVFR